MSPIMGHKPNTGTSRKRAPRQIDDSLSRDQRRQQSELDERYAARPANFPRREDDERYKP